MAEAMLHFRLLASEEGPLAIHCLATALIVTSTVTIIDRLHRKPQRTSLPLKSLMMIGALWSPVLGVLFVAPLAIVVNGHLGDQTALTASGPVLGKNLGRSPSFTLHDRATGDTVSFRAYNSEVQALELGQTVTRSYWRGCLGICYERAG